MCYVSSHYLGIAQETDEMFFHYSEITLQFCKGLAHITDKQVKF